MTQNSLKSSMEPSLVILEVAGMVLESCIALETEVRNYNQARHIQKQIDLTIVGTIFVLEIRNKISQGIIKMDHIKILLLMEVEILSKQHKIWMVH